MLRLIANNAVNESPVNFTLEQAGTDVNILANGNLVAYFSIQSSGKIALELTGCSGELFEKDGGFIAVRK